jgi:hypothetical protein
MNWQGKYIFEENPAKLPLFHLCDAIDGIRSEILTKLALKVEGFCDMTPSGLDYHYNTTAFIFRVEECFSTMKLEAVCFSETLIRVYTASHPTIHQS